MLLSALLLALPVLVLAAPGDLDPSFDGDGKVLTDFRGFDFARALVAQPDHKLAAAGEDVRVGSSSGALARYNPDGSLDRSFGGDGRVRLNFGGRTEPFALVLQPDGKLVVAGSAGEIPLLSDVLLARFNPNGSLDTSFGAGGIVQTDFGRGDTAFALTLQPDGKLVVAGVSRSGSIGDPVDLILARYHPDGSLDASFGAVAL